MSEANLEAQQQTQQGQPMSTGIDNSTTEFLLGGINSGNTPALASLKEAESGANTPQPPAQPQVDPMLNTPMNQQGAPDVLGANPSLDERIQQQEQQFRQAEEAQQQLEQQNQVPNELTENNPLAGPTDNAQQQAEQEALLDSPLLKIKPQEQAQPEVNPLEGVQGIDQINQYLSSKVEGVADLNSLIQSHNDLEKNLTSLSDTKTNYETLVNGLRNLPADLIQAIELSEKGEDYKSYIASSPSLDYSKNADEINSRDLINAYHPGKVSEADFEAADPKSDDYDPNVERYVKSLEENSLEKFKNDKSAYNTKVDDYIARSAKQKEAFTNSVKQSMGSLKTLFPDAESSYVSNVEQQLLKNGIDSLFYDENGYLKEDAAARFVMASDDGRDLLAKLQTIAYDKAKTEANLDILTRSQRTAPEKGGMTMRQDVNEDRVKAYVQDVVGNINPKKRF